MQANPLDPVAEPEGVAHLVRGPALEVAQRDHGPLRLGQQRASAMARLATCVIATRSSEDAWASTSAVNAAASPRRGIPSPQRRERGGIVGRRHRRRPLRPVLVARRGRLRSRFDEWPAVAAELAADCVSRSRDLAGRDEVLAGYADDAALYERSGDVPCVAYIAAHAAGRARGPGAMFAERERQAAWIATRLGLTA